MKASELVRLPRCTFVGRDPIVGITMRCALWQGHQQTDHAPYKDVIREMTEAIITVRGLDPDGVMNSLAAIPMMAQARMWYARLVDDNE